MTHVPFTQNELEDEGAGEGCDRIFYPVSYRVLNLWARERAFIHQRSARIRERSTDNPSDGLDSPISQPQSSHHSDSKGTGQREALHER